MIFVFFILSHTDDHNQVPIRQKSINEIGARYYSKPAPFHIAMKVAVPQDWAQQGFDTNKVKPVSPMENVIAFVLSHGWSGFDQT